MNRFAFRRVGFNLTRIGKKLLNLRELQVSWKPVSRHVDCFLLD